MKDLVACLMTILVVHGLEPIQINEHHRQPLAAAQGVRHDLLQAVCQHQAVGQTGEAIKVGHLFKLCFVLFECGDIRVKRHVVRHAAVCVLDGADGHQVRKHLAVFASVPDLSSPLPLGLERVPQGLEKRWVMSP